jgi:hypothetical protein
MKKLYTLGIILFLILSISLYSQNSEQSPGKSRQINDQSQLYNDVNSGYGVGSLYIFTGEVSHSYNNYSGYGTRSEINSVGAFMIGYNRMVSKAVMVGIVASYINVHFTRPYTGSTTGYQGKATYNDNLWNAMARVTFNYVNKPIVRIYSGAGMGITVVLSNVEAPGKDREKERKIYPAGQLIFMGVRFGRTFGGFCEFGIGTNSIISAGLNYQFGD